MGRKSRLKKETNKDNNNQTYEKTTTISRRKLLTSSSIALFGLVSGVYILEKYFNDKWDFLENPSDEFIKKHTKINLKKYGSLIMEDKELSKNSFDYLTLKEIYTDNKIISLLKQNNFDLINTEYKITPYKTRIVLPTNTKKNFLKYVKTAYEFLHNEIKGLKPINFSWYTAKANEDLSNLINNKIIIGNSYYDILKLSIINKKKPEQFIDVYYRFGNTGGANNTEFKLDELKIKSWYIILCQGNHAINSLFSELLPLYAAESTHRYRLKTNIKEAIYATESFSEAASFFLGEKICKELEIPNGLNYIRKTQNSLYNQDRYKYVKKAEIWMQKNGIQEGIDLYIENPKKFMDEIQKI